MAKLKYITAPLGLGYMMIFGFSLILIGNSIYMQAKAYLAQTLINQSWQEAMAAGDQIRPWPWSDTWPVSRIIMPQHQVDLIVLAGDDGRTLAFGPGARLSGPMPGEPGLSMISAHRDTYFQFLEQVNIGERFALQTAAGKMLRYRVSAIQIVESPRLELPVAHEESQIVLVTCYPFHALTSGGPQRYIVYAVRDDGLEV